jgi:hypothetical protein
MPTKNPLRRFAELRRLRRRAKQVSVQTVASRRRAIKRVGLNLRVSILPRAIARLAQLSKFYKIPRPRLLGTILEWFASQPKGIQAAILDRSSKPRSSRFSNMLLKQLLAG